MPLERLIIQNGLNVDGNSVITGSITVSQPFTNASISGSFTGSFSGSGAGITGTRATITNMPAGTVELIYADEIQSTGTANATAKSYVLASNTYSRVIYETECRFRNNVNTNGIVTFNILVGAVNKRSHQIEADAVAAVQFDQGRVLKFSEVNTAGGTVTVTTSGFANGTWTVDSLRVYGVK
jgi:hypothetical protein